LLIHVINLEKAAIEGNGQIVASESDFCDGKVVFIEGHTEVSD